MRKNIVLCGFMGSGKTVTGRLVAKQLERKFIDLDEWIEQRQGLSVKEIFARYGEARFRQLETEAAEELGRSDGLVIACGGGTVLRPENTAALKANGMIFYLRVSADTVKRRLKNDSTRPLLAGDRDAAVDALLAAREPAYRAAADDTVDADGTAEQAAGEIIDIYRGAEAARNG